MASWASQGIKSGGTKTCDTYSLKPSQQVRGVRDQSMEAAVQWRWPIIFFAAAGTKQYLNHNQLRNANSHGALPESL
eukprot:scaffold69426_cov55-Prasinocladus_malaysianus.AAC.1